ncbi:hypothetical protein CWE13_09145 [Aliidiomarina shirensis]|uniref:Beta-lactamase n=1 Tax=Aliidiomarina shirensis TaxID=1048642 RepID=A0A432WT95_9GAMM|nr:serine hydrolase [Aliidiomarina shirensis]RUO36995.1 hypothetical protein CWE13_09145 [Aliidiomarina shirensis]
MQIFAKRTIFSSLIISSGLLLGCSDQVSSENPETAAMQGITVESSTQVTEAIKARIERDSSTACIAAARLQRNDDGGVRSERGFYCADEQSALPTADSRYEIGSVSKAMLGGIYAHLVAEGKLDINQPLQDWVPEGIEVPQFSENPILLRHMLTHTSGLPRLPARLMPAEVNDPYADFTEEALWQSLAEAQLVAEPGEQFGYSNFAFMLLSNIAAKASGVPLAELYEQTLYTPLGMVNASFTGETMQPLSAEGDQVLNWNFAEDMQGVGGVRASLSDMEAWVSAQLGFGPEALTTAFATSHEVLAETEQVNVGWAWLHAPVQGNTYITHGGGTGGFATMVAINPETQQAAIVLSNAALYQTGDVQALALHLLDANIPPGTPHMPIMMPDSVNLEDYFGYYELVPGFVVHVFAENGELMIQATGQPSAPVTYSDADVFENIAYGARFVFDRNEEGDVVSVTLYQAGQELSGERRLTAD